MNRRNLFFFLVLLSLPAAAAQAQKLAGGAVIPKVVCRENAGQSYALYLPSHYSEGRQWPVLYGFDPFGSGESAIANLKAAAEKHGYIVAVSNNSQNGPIQPSLDAAQAMWRDTHQRLALDDARAYTFGLSGGARVAAYLALRCPNCFAGVVANGAGLPLGTDAAPKISFPYFLAFGDGDFNYAESVKLSDTLEKAAAIYRIRIYDGGHQWAFPEIWEESLAWLDLLAKRGKPGAADDPFVKEQFRQRQQYAAKLESDGQQVRALREYQAMMRDFSGLGIDLAPVRQKLEALKNSKELTASRKREQAELERQRALAEPALQDLSLLSQPGGDAQAFERLAETLSHWREKVRSRQASEAPDREMVVLHRALDQVYIDAFESAQQSLREHKYEPAMAQFRLLQRVSPKNPYASYQLARAYAGAGDGKHALATLQQAAENGFSDAAQLDVPEFERLKANPEFKAIQEKMK